MPRKLATTSARSRGLGFGRTKPRNAKNAAIDTIKLNVLITPNTPRQPARSPITPASDAPNTLPVRPTASSRPIATWRFSTGTRSPTSAMPMGKIPPASAPATMRIATSSGKLVASAQTMPASDTTSRLTFINRVLPKKSAIVPRIGCTSA